MTEIIFAYNTCLLIGHTIVICLGGQDDGNKAADVDSIKLEQKFLDNDQDVVEFRAGSQSYSLSLKGEQTLCFCSQFCAF